MVWWMAIPVVWTEWTVWWTACPVALRGSTVGSMDETEWRDALRGSMVASKVVMEWKASLRVVTESMVALKAAKASMVD